MILILGGARSGKSSYAQKWAEDSGKSVTFIATAQASDDEMSARITKHQIERPKHWQTLEIPYDIASALQEIKSEVLILDCVTLLVTNLIMNYFENDILDEEKSKQAVEKEIESLLKMIRESKKEWLIVSNEVGLGLVPPYLLGRMYRDLLGWANQRLAKEADEVLFMVAGIPMKVK
jgi:adenosylcobinamide kinase/adenosylcobinamide-phosphate guanylyltransferase